MAVGARSVSNEEVTGKNDRDKNHQKKEGKSQENAVPSSPAKRNKSPGIRVLGGRIYDSVNGKTCHQCRQKTMDFMARCKNQRTDKPCPIMYCHKCLLNRYGEKAEEVAALREWNCPKCRDICNCSICMKKRGHQPTGTLVNAAKATGYSSVSEMLLKGAAELLNQETVAVMAASPIKAVVPSPRKRWKENSFDGKIDSDLPNHVDKKSKKAKELNKGDKDDINSLKVISQCPDNRKSKQDGSEDNHDCNKKLGVKENGSHGHEKSKKMKRDGVGEVNNPKNEGEILKEINMHDDEKKPKKSKRSELVNNDSRRTDATLARRGQVQEN